MKELNLTPIEKELYHNTWTSSQRQSFHRGLKEETPKEQNVFYQHGTTVAKRQTT
jgi:hypothetical protein